MTQILRPLPVNNFAATVAPTTTNDTTQGYSIGSLWFNTVNGLMWRAYDVTTNAAIWGPLQSGEHPGIVASRFYPLVDDTLVGTNSVPTIDTVLFLHPFCVPHIIAPATIGVWIVTAASAGGGVKFGIWANGAASHLPAGTPLTGLVSNAGQSTVVTGAFVSIPCTGTLYPGLTYWFGAAYGVAAPKGLARTATTPGWTSRTGRTSIAQAPVTAQKTAFTYGNDITALSLTGAGINDVVTGDVPIPYIGT